MLPLIELTYNNSYHSSIRMAPYEVLYGRKCRTSLCWFESGESLVLGSDVIQQTSEQVRMIREKMKAAQHGQKSYIDKRRRPLEFQEGDHVFMRVSPRTGISRAIKSRKLTPRFIGPFQILRRVGQQPTIQPYPCNFLTFIMSFMYPSSGSITLIHLTSLSLSHYN